MMPLQWPLRHVKAVAALTLVTGAFLLALQLVCLRIGVHVGELTIDAASITKSPWYFGVISNFGLGVWGAAIGCAGLGWAVGRAHPAAREASLALAGLALVSVLLATDDNLQVHEYLVPTYLHLKEKVPYAIYALVALAWAIRFRRVLLGRVPLPLAIAGLGFAGSIVADQIADSGTLSVPYVVEDGLKLVGQLNWALASFLLARSAVADAVAGGAETAPSRHVAEAVQRVSAGRP